MMRCLGWPLGIAASGAIHASWLVCDPPAAARHGLTTANQEVTLEPVRAQPEPPAPEPSRAEPEERAPIPTHASRAAERTTGLAQAGRTLTARPDGDGDTVADFTMVQGAGDAYAGGVTAPSGSSKSPRYAEPSRPGPAVAAASAPPIDRSAPAGPMSLDWSCSDLFPSGSDAVDRAAVLVAVTVGIDGAPSSVAILSDPGHGFAAAARACAMRQRYSPALAPDGRPAVGTTPPITVRFTR